MERYNMIVTRDSVGTYIYKLILIERGYLRPVYQMKANELIPLTSIVQAYLQECVTK